MSIARAWLAGSSGEGQGFWTQVPGSVPSPCWVAVGAGQESTPRGLQALLHVMSHLGNLLLDNQWVSPLCGAHPRGAFRQMSGSVRGLCPSKMYCSLQGDIMWCLSFGGLRCWLPYEGAHHVPEFRQRSHMVGWGLRASTSWAAAYHEGPLLSRGWTLTSTLMVWAPDASRVFQHPTFQWQDWLQVSTSWKYRKEYYIYDWEWTCPCLRKFGRSSWAKVAKLCSKTTHFWQMWSNGRFSYK